MNYEEATIEQIVESFEQGKSLNIGLYLNDKDYSMIYLNYRKDPGIDAPVERLHDLTQEEIYMFLSWVLMSEGRM